jgi:hypothetical protein
MGSSTKYRRVDAERVIASVFLVEDERYAMECDETIGIAVQGAYCDAQKWGEVLGTEVDSALGVHQREQTDEQTVGVPELPMPMWCEELLYHAASHEEDAEVGKVFVAPSPWIPRQGSLGRRGSEPQMYL